MRVAVIDMGSNSTRLLVADVAADGLQEVERLLETTRLGAKVDQNHALGKRAMNRTRKVVNGYVERAREQSAEAILASATSAVRDSRNGEEFMRDLARECGIVTRILTGDEEARATFRGATALHPPTEPTAVIDVGGGSTEVVVGVGSQVLGAVSLQLGCVRATERWLGDNRVSPEQLTAARQGIDEVLDAHLPQELARGTTATPIAVAGTATTLAALELKLPGYDPERIDGHRVERDKIAAWIARLAPLTAAERCADYPAIVGGRGSVLIGGALVLLAVLDAMDADAYIASESDILQGMALGIGAPV